MMRKDVKVGLASGAVLLAVGIVYVSSINKPPTARQVSKLDRSAGTAVTERGTSSNSNSGGTRIVIGETGGEPARAPVTETVAVANAPTEQDWSKLLGTGVPPALMSHTPAPGEAPSPAAADPVDVFAESTPIGGNAMTAAGVSTPTAPSLSATVTTAAPAVPVAPAIQMGPARSDRANSAMASAAASGTYVVKEGESFYTIARDVYGNSHFFPHIQRANPDIVPNRIRAGMRINLPSPESVKPSATAHAAAAARTQIASPTAQTRSVGVSEYRVQENENLYRIAVKLYGSPKKMQEIYELNKATIGSDPAKVKVGTVLKLPAGARSAR